MNIIGLMIQELYRIFEIVNKEKFDNLLPLPVITIQRTKGNIMGHFVTSKNWRNKNNVVDDNPDIDENDSEAQYEINIDPRWFYKNSAIDTTQILIHEMCHYWNKVNDINDGNHNKKFKAIAERVGLVCERGQNVGYGYTTLSPELEYWVVNVIKPNQSVFNYYSASTNKPTVTREKKTFKYTCPVCGLVVKGKRDIEIKCVECDELMEMEDED